MILRRHPSGTVDGGERLAAKPPGDACPDLTSCYARAMRGLVPPDPEHGVSQPSFAIVYMPGRARKRFPAGCVEILESLEQALDRAKPEARWFAARVLGPSKSSEGLILYYLLEWLDPPKLPR